MKGIESLTFHSSERPTRDTTCGIPHTLRGTRRNSRPRDFSVLLSTLQTPKYRVPNPQDLVPPVPPTIDDSDLIGGSRFAISTCMYFLHSPTPICRCIIANGLPRAPARGLPRSSSTTCRSTGFCDSARQLQVVDSLPLKNSPLLHLCLLN
jgi:hypothetical protein